MPRTLADLAADLEQLAATLPPSVGNNLSIEALEVILTDLLEVTPVDTGKAISNWQVRLDKPVADIISAHYPGKFGATAVVNREATLAAALDVLSRKKPGQTIYLGNALPYIRRLNDGWSSQAPAGFIERAILLGRLFTEDPKSFAPVG